jgi:hypothetical protein
MKKRLLAILLLVLICANMAACGAKECAFPGCDAKAVKGQIYCAEHQEIKDALPEGGNLIPAK